MCLARLGARTSNQASHEDKWLHYLTFSPLVCNCMPPPAHPPSLSQNPILLCAPPVFPHLFIISLHKKALSFFFAFFSFEAHQQTQLDKVLCCFNEQLRNEHVLINLVVNNYQVCQFSCLVMSSLVRDKLSQFSCLTLFLFKLV